MYQTAVGYAVWGIILVSSISNLAGFLCTSDPALCILTGFLESLETCFRPPGCHKKIILWKHYFSIPLMTFYCLMLIFI